MTEQQEPPQPVTEPDRPKLDASLIGFWVAFTVLTLAGAAASLLFGFASVMSSDACMGHATGWICTSSGQELAFALPWLGWGLAIVASLVGVGLRRHHDWAHWMGLFVGGTLWFLVVLGSYAAVSDAIR